MQGNRQAGFIGLLFALAALQTHPSAQGGDEAQVDPEAASLPWQEEDASEVPS